MNLRKAVAYGTVAAATALALGGAVLIGNRMQYAMKTRPLERQAYQMKQEENEMKAANAEMNRRLSGYTRFVVQQGTTRWKDMETGEIKEWTGPSIYKELTLNPDMSIRTDSIGEPSRSAFREDFSISEFRGMPMKKQQERMQ